MATIGKNILENLTTGMYADSKVIYREYVQNACSMNGITLAFISASSAELKEFICPTPKPTPSEANFLKS